MMADNAVNVKEMMAILSSRESQDNVIEAMAEAYTEWHLQYLYIYLPADAWRPIVEQNVPLRYSSVSS